MAKLKTPEEVVGSKKYFDRMPYGGLNCSLGRLYNKECVVAYLKIDVITYLLIKTSKGYSAYAVVDLKPRLDGYNVSFGKIINKSLIILDEEEYDKFLKIAIVESL